jgi:hypothetical protein
MAWLFTHLGPNGLMALQVGAWSTAGALVLLLARRSSRDVLAAGTVYVLFASTIAGSMGIRPQLATYLLFPVLLLILETARRGPAGVLLCLPPLFVPWVNLHADPAAPYPTGALRYIEETGIAGNMVSYFDWAQVVLFRYHPGIRIAYDGRFRTVYPIAVETAFFDLIGERPSANWRRMLYDWPTQWVLVPTDGDCAARMRKEPGWWLVYQDRMAALFRRATGSGPGPETVFRTDPGPSLPF